MATDEASLILAVETLVQRFFRQNGSSAPDGLGAAMGRRLFALIGRRGLPAPLPAGEMGAPGSMFDADLAAAVAELLAGSDDPLLSDLAKQLVKGCFYPEFRVCRESYRTVTPKDGSCRRQELGRARGRISGAHCVDCPYWVELNAAEHAALLRSAWCGPAQTFEANRGVFLPEDFRVFRRWLHRRARGE